MAAARSTEGHNALLLVARHAPVDAEGLCYGQTDLPAVVPDPEVADAIVASLGRAKLPYERAARVWSSPLRRCAGPAARLAEQLRIPHLTDARLSELSFGSWDGRPYDELAREDPQALAKFFDGWAEGAAPPGGEGIGELERRVRDWVREVGAGVQLVVAHAGVVRALRVIIRGASWPQAMGAGVEPLAVEAFHWEAAP